MPPDLAQVLDDQWKEQGYRSKSDYVAVLLGEAHGIDVNVRMNTRGDQELPLTG